MITQRRRQQSATKKEKQQREEQSATKKEKQQREEEFEDST
jgi:hypothetical protein